MTAGEDNIKSLAMVLTAIKSAEECRRVEIEYKDGLPYLKSAVPRGSRPEKRD